MLCPPFGWDDTCTYRTRRAWAEALAQAGHPAVRIDLPGTGDSAGSPYDPERLVAWPEAIAAAAHWLRVETGCTRIAALGIGLGGMMAWLAAARGAAIDDLVLWGVPTQGGRLLREMRAAALLYVDERLESGDLATGAWPDAPVVPGGAALVDLGGHVMSKETVDVLSALDLTKLPLAHASRRRILLFESDGAGLATGLLDHCADSGAEVTVASGEGYAAMMRTAQHAEVPKAAIARSLSWLSDAPDANAGTRTAAVAESRAAVRALETLELRQGGTTIRETPLSLEIDSERLFAILTEPATTSRSDVCAVLINVASDRRIGPNRAWVETARRWAARGVPVVRLDQPGIGDSDSEEVYEETAKYYQARVTDRTVALLNELEARDLPARFVLVGFCTGAYWSFQGALADLRVVGAFAINLPFFFRTWWAVNVLHAWARRRRSMPEDRPGIGWARRAVERLFPALPFAHRALHWLRPGPDRVDKAMNQLHERNVEILLMFSAREPQYEELMGDRRIDRLDRLPRFHVRRIPGRDHSFRVPSAQRYVSDELDKALDRVVRADGAARSSGVAPCAPRSENPAHPSDAVVTPATRDRA